MNVSYKDIRMTSLVFIVNLSYWSNLQPGSCGIEKTPANGIDPVFVRLLDYCVTSTHLKITSKFSSSEIHSVQGYTAKQQREDDLPKMFKVYLLEARNYLPRSHASVKYGDCKTKLFQQVDPFQPSNVLQIETSRLICYANQITHFHVKGKTGLKRVNLSIFFTQQ